MFTFTASAILATTTSHTPAAPPRHAWSALERELDALTAGLAQPNAGPTVGGWIRTRYANSGDVDTDTVTPSSQDLGGFNLDNARIFITGRAADGYGYTLSAEGGDGAISDAAGASVASDVLSLLDAYASVTLGDWASVSIGRFSSTFLWSSGIEDRRLMFLERGFLGEVWDGRDVGFELSGTVDRFNWWAAVQNGSDSTADEYALSSRLSYHVLGASLRGDEGCHGLHDDEHLTIGVAWFDDARLDDGTAVGADALFAKGRWSSIAEIVDFDDDVRPGAAINSSTGAVIPTAASITGAETPWNVSLGYMLAPDEWEIAARYQDLDDDDETTVVTAALDRYIAGHDAKWTLQFDRARSDAAALEVDVWAVGLTVGF
ncbi:MAG: porin [Planctomycetota bacterium]